MIAARESEHSSRGSCKMATKTARPKKFVKYHKNGSVWAKGQMIGGTMVGYWEFFRKDGTKLRSGYFEDGKQAGKWTTYGSKGKVYKVTMMRPKPK